MSLSTGYSMTILRLDGVKKQYGAMTALSSIDLSIDRGEFVTLLGPSGSGKSTILNLVAGMIPPTSGTIWIEGADVTALAPSKRGLGMVFQNYALMPHMTVFDNIAFPLRIRRVGAKEMQRKIREVLEIVQLPDVEKRKPRELSGGQQQRVALARCLVYNPSIILMDEPLGALDKRLREQIQLEIARLHAELGITVLFVTHDQEEALTLSDRIVLMNHGRIVQEGAPGELYRAPRSVFAADFLGDANLLAGKVVDASDVVRVRTFAGRDLVAMRTSFAQPGTAVRVMVRPENVIIRRSNEAISFDNMFEGIVEGATLLGSFVKYHIRVDGQRILAKVIYRPDEPLPTTGDSVTLGCRIADLTLLPEDEPAARTKEYNV
jgi:putative spermidine/putrescine transport system ATP-binding protein